MEKECSELDGRRQEEGEGRDPGRHAPKQPRFLNEVLSAVARPSPCILSPCSSRDTERVKQISSETYLYPARSFCGHFCPLCHTITYYHIWE